MTADDPARLAEDWATIWHSELAAIAADAEAAETWRGAATAWARALAPASPHEPPGRAGADAAAGAEAAAAASARRIERRLAALARRIGELERRLDLIGQPAPAPAPAPPRRTRRA